MIKEIPEDLFKLKADALAHGCNTKGIMDAGIALEFKRRYPKMFDEYTDYCRSDLLKPGEVHFYRDADGRKPYIVNIAAQITPSSGARIEYVERGLVNVGRSYKDWRIKSLAIPKIGCGLGRLKWSDVDNIVRRIFGASDLEVIIALGKSTDS